MPNHIFFVILLQITHIKMKHIFYCILVAVSLLASCASHHEIAGISRTRILIDSTYDSPSSTAATAFMTPYKKSVDSLMTPVVGHLARYMWSARPESNLSNLLSDILIWASKAYDENPDFALYNMGGIRASMSEGAVTYGDIVDVAPFENKICFFDLSGDAVNTLFQQIARNGGEGVSHGIQLVISKSGELLSARINGEEIDTKRTYRVASIDYLAQGNDGLTALKDKTNYRAPNEQKNNLRYIITDYFKDKDAKGETVDSKVEGRITVR